MAPEPQAPEAQGAEPPPAVETVVAKPAAAEPARARAEPPPRGAGAVLRAGVRANWRWGLAVVVCAGLVLVMGWFYLEEEATAPPASRLGTGSGVASDLMQPTSPAYREATEEADSARRDEAVGAGESFVPTFQSQGGRVAEPAVAEPLRPSAAAPSAAAATPAPVAATPAAAAAKSAAVTPPAEDDDPMLVQTLPEPEARSTALVRREARTAQAPALGAMFEQLLERWNAAPEMQLVRYDVEGSASAESVAAVQGAAPMTGDAGAPAPSLGPVLVPAGRLLYASTKVGVDSDLALPVLVEVHEPPLRGALLTGEFQQVGERVVLRFSRLSDPERGLDAVVEAYAVGLDSEVGAVEGEVTRHWFSRVLLPAALGFAGEYLRAAGETGTRVVVDGVVVTEEREDEASARIARGLAGAVGQAGQVALEAAPRRATVRLPRGTELAVVFVAPVRADSGAQG